MPKIRFEGIEDLEKALKEKTRLDAVKKIVRQHGSGLQKLAQEKANFRGHYGYVKGKKGKQFIKPTGTLKKSIGLELTDNGMTAEVEPTVEYAAYVELGTRFMDAQPYLKPAYNEQKEKFKRDMDKLVQ